MRVYIAGPISGMPDNNKAAFEDAKEWLIKYDMEPVSPLDGITDEDLPYVEYIKRGLDLLNTCQAIFLMDNWNESYGARMEFLFAKRMGKIFISFSPIILEEVKLSSEE